MKKKSFLAPLILGVLLLAAFIIFTVLISKIGVKTGAYGTVGFYDFNAIILEFFGKSKPLYFISTILGYAVLGALVAYAVTHIILIIKNFKSGNGWSVRSFVLFAFYGITMIAYLAFEGLKINNRPLFLLREIEASYPSSHTLLNACFVAGMVCDLDLIIKNKTIRKIISAILVSVASLIIVFRTACGVHWFTDILGGIILSASLICLYVFTQNFINYSKIGYELDD